MTIPTISKRLFLPVILVLFVPFLATSSAFAIPESHPKIGEFDRSGPGLTEAFSNPNGIAIDEASGDVYVADIGTDTVYKFDAEGKPVDFSTLGSNALTGVPARSGKAAESFSFPQAASDAPAALAVDNSKSRSDPSSGDLYVMDDGKGVIDKFKANGEFLSQIGGLAGRGELLGLGIDASGTVHVDLRTPSSEEFVVDELDDSAANHFIAEQVAGDAQIEFGGVPDSLQAHGFAVGPTGDNYQVYEGCSCAVKLGQRLSALGRIDEAEAGDVAAAVDPVTGHVYIDDQSSVGEWDTGAMNRDSVTEAAAGTLVSRFGAPYLTTSSGQGGIAVDGATGAIYVSNPFEKNVLVFASDAPALTLDATSGVTQSAAVVHGTVDPRGVRISECRFEYGVTDEYGRVTERGGTYEHRAPCEPAAGGIAPVAVEAKLEDLKAGELYRYRLVAENANGSTQNSGLVATPGSGFGIKSFELSFLNDNGEPDTQAGSHPTKLFNGFTLYTHFERIESNADSPYIRQPNGVLKDVIVDFPPGIVGDPNAIPKKCALDEIASEKGGNATGDNCPAESKIGLYQLNWSGNEPFVQSYEQTLYNMVPPRGVAVQLGTNFVVPLLFIDNDVRAGGDYPIQATVVNAPPAAPTISARVTVNGIVGEGATRKAFLTMPTGCNGPLRSVMYADSWQEPGNYKSKEYVSSNAAGTPVSMSGCANLRFPPEISVAPDSTDASTSSGLTVHVKVPQTAAFNTNGLAESALRDTTVTLPEGVAINPSGADGLQACTSDPGALPKGNEEQEVLGERALGTAGNEIGFKGFKELNKQYEEGVQWATFTSEKPNPLEPGVNFCPDGSKIATVKIKTPLLEHEVEGAMYLATQNANPFGGLIAMYLVAEDPFSGSLVKLVGEVKLSPTGQIVTTFENTPELPFEDLEIHFFGGERAPLTTPSRCGTYTTSAVFTPWDGNGTVPATSSFVIDHGPHGGPCPGATLPFDPSLTAGTTSIQASGLSPFTMTMSREDGQQNLQAISLEMPPGLSGALTGVELCPEAQANAGTCGPNSLIGETVVSVGVGNDPFSVKGGKVYLTAPYKGAPFGLSIVNPAKAGPYDVEHDTSKPAENMPGCDCIVVRAKIEVNPVTADITVTSDNEGPYKIPTILDGIPLQIQHVNVMINRSGFTFNPTNCEPLAINAALHSTEGSTSLISVPFQVTNCARLSFKPSFKVSTNAKTSRHAGASLHVLLSYPKLPFGTQANIKSVKVDLPKQLPSRLETLKRACLDTVFNQDPAACPPASRVGHAKATTPIVPVPLEGPAYFVSHGGAKFPELIVVLQGYGVTVDLHGETFISKGITSSTFHTIPDVPVGTFELTLPQGAYSALAANGNLCASSLKMPTLFNAQNGMVIKQSTPITVAGCVKRKAHKHKKKHARHERKERRR
jgi:DNA-binding beta-propeller fold protein YncE